jgi:hypothetical protein
MICKCGMTMLYLVGNSGVKAWWCHCGRAALSDNGSVLHDEGKVYKWYEPSKEKEDA